MRFGGGQGHDRRGTLPGAADDGDRAVVATDNPFHQTQPEPCTSGAGGAGRIGLTKPLDPVWEFRDVVCPSGFAVLRIAADVSALVAGGYRQIVMK
jgi:hypothetical protein